MIDLTVIIYIYFIAMVFAFIFAIKWCVKSWAVNARSLIVFNSLKLAIVLI